MFFLEFVISQAQHVGKYLLSPSATPTADGFYTAGLSVRSGQGSGTHDRVMQFVPTFLSPQAAMAYALEQGLRCVRLPSLAA